MIVILLLLAAFVLFVLGSFRGQIGKANPVALGLAALALAMLWPTLAG